MRLAAFTPGPPGIPLAHVLVLAAEHGWEGLELRCAPANRSTPA